MRGSRSFEVTLTEDERAGITRPAWWSTAPQRLAQRVHIVLAMADGANNEQIARQLGVNPEPLG